MSDDVLNTIKSKLFEFQIADYFREMYNINAQVDMSKYQLLKIAILRSYTCETIDVILKLQLILERYRPELFFGKFNQYSQEILNPQSELYQFKPDLIILFIRIEDLLPNFITRYHEKTYSEWQNEFNYLLQHLGGVFHKVAESTDAQLLVQNFCLFFPYFGIYDTQQTSGQSNLLQSFNQSLKSLAGQLPNLFIWDFAQFVTRHGYLLIHDPKMWYVARNPYSQDGYIRIASDLMRYILSILGKTIKCIVLDLDNTLWGGVIGEDGIQGIALGDDYPGNCYVDFQLELLKLYHRGIILAINSKNNEQDVFEVLDKHPHMILRRKHFAAMRVNWQDKLSNLQALAEELNIGIDSIAFIDDNPVECALISQYCACRVIKAPSHPYLMPQLIHSMPLVDNIRLTDEDLKKGEIYYIEMSRKTLEKSSPSLDAFLKNLEMRLEVKPADDFTVTRIAQLTQKTNQFNMTTKRYQEADIIKFINSEVYAVFVVSARDRFGDYGNIGVFILEFNDEVCLIDTFLLSCRVIGRTIEQSMLAFIVDFCRSHGISKLTAEFVLTAKNALARNFYSEQGLIFVGGNKFEVDLNAIKFSYSAFTKIN